MNALVAGGVGMLLVLWGRRQSRALFKALLYVLALLFFLTACAFVVRLPQL